jgi:hypothetical protein
MIGSGSGDAAREEFFPLDEIDLWNGRQACVQD